MHRLSFQVPSNLIYLEDVLSQFERVKSDWIPPKIWLQCQLALAEGFTNAVRHAHCHKSEDTPVEIEIELNKEEIIIKIWDYGKHFKLETKSVSQAQSQDLATGGRGIKIMQQIADEIRYDHLPDNRNCLIIIKRIK